MHKIITQNQFDDSLTQYGDGVFETMLAVGNNIHHWRYHWARLQSSCERLAIAVPDEAILTQQLQTVLMAQGDDFSVVKMLVGRGEGLRGYRSLPEQPCAVQFRVSPFQLNTALYQGLNVRVCQARLAAQPLLAGMKHCNRLEYVMARREAAESQFDEGLLLDYDGHFIEGLISNVFLIKNQHFYTPALDTAGVAGTMRAYLLEALPATGREVTVTPLTMNDVEAADAVFLTNATAGVMPVKRIQGIDKTYSCESAQAIRQEIQHPCSVV